LTVSYTQKCSTFVGLRAPNPHLRLYPLTRLGAPLPGPRHPLTDNFWMRPWLVAPLFDDNNEEAVVFIRISA